MDEGRTDGQMDDGTDGWMERIISSRRPLLYVIVRICFELTHIKENAKEKTGMRSKRLSRIINREGN